MTPATIRRDEGGQQSSGRPVVTVPGAAVGPTCNRCGFEVSARAFGCKNPCPNCGTVYPLGDCSD